MACLITRVVRLIGLDRISRANFIVEGCWVGAGGGIIWYKVFYSVWLMRMPTTISNVTVFSLSGLNI